MILDQTRSAREWQLMNWRRILKESCRPALIICSSVAGAVSVAAQTPTPVALATVTGSVYDSLSHAPLTGAIVQVVREMAGTADTSPRQTWTAISDSLGDFTLQLPRGRYFAGFQHPVLSGLGLESPVKSLDVSDQASSTVLLAIPSARTVRRLVCPGADSAHTGLITGILHARGAVRDWQDGDIVAEWGDVIVKGGHIVPVAQQQQASTDDSGMFRVCGVPPDGSVKFSARVKGFHPIETDVTLGDEGVLRRDLYLAPLSEVRGAASIALRVTDSTRTRSLAATVTVPELHRQVELFAKTDTLRDLPEGSWALRIRALGFAPRELLVDAHAAEFGDTVLTVRLIPIAQTLAPVRVVAKRDQRVLDDIDERMRVAAGTLIKAGDPFLATAMEASDAIRAGRGFIWKGPTRIETGRPASTRGGSKPCASTSSNTPLPAAGPVQGRMEIAIYLDGSRVPGGLETVNNMVRPDDILAIETYPEVLSAPFLWRTPDACAVVAFWTKHRAGS